MDTIRKSLVLSGAAALGIFGIVLIVKYLLRHHDGIKFEAAGKGIDEKLQESMVALDKATVSVQQIFENLKSQKSSA